MTKQDLHNMYNGTSGLDEVTKDLETYENWLERQLISRIETIKNFESEESITERNTNVVSAFMDHCKNEWCEIPDRMFETYFNA